MKKSIITISLFASLLFFLSGCESKSTKESVSKEPSPSASRTVSKAEERTVVLTDVNGKKLVLKQVNNGFKIEGNDKILMVDFFATWCPPCKAEIPHLVNLQNKYKDKIKIIGILMEENKDIEELKNFIKYFNINYDIFVGRGNYDLASLLGGVSSIPLLVMYDKDGNYITHYMGAVPEEMIERDIQRALDER